MLFIKYGKRKNKEKPNRSISDIIIISSSSNRCYKIYWSMALKDLSVSCQIISFLKNYGMSFWGGGLTKSDRKGHGGGQMSIL